MPKVLVIGGGAAGVMAAIVAARNGADVTIWEKNDRIGKKLAITGKGRCNVTNAAPIDEIIKNIPGNGRFMHSAFYQYDNQDVMNFFEELGVKLKVERGQRVFPVSDSAKEIIRALEDEIHRLHIKVRYNMTATKLVVKDGALVGAEGFGVSEMADRVILATGGATYVGTGSTGDGYKIAGAVGHSITDIMPSLVPLVAAEPWVSEMAGLSLRNVELTIYKDGVIGKKTRIASDFGEMMFTHFGITGPLVLSLSRPCAGLWQKDSKQIIQARINLKPALTAEQLAARLARDFEKYAAKHISNSLDDILPKSMIPVIINVAQIDPATPVKQLDTKEIGRLLELMQAFPLTLTGTRPLSEGIVTVGGVNIKEINPKTFESKVLPNLYIVGELMDVDAYTGGYNLQVAFSSGYVAGVEASYE